MRHVDPRADLERLRAFPTVRLGRWPTPLERVGRADGIALWVKRDDLCGYGAGGVKPRKIERLVGYWLDRGIGEVLTVAGNVAQVVFDLLPALDAHAIGARIWIVDDPPMSEGVRAAIFARVRGRVHLLGRGRGNAARRLLAAWAAGRAAGRRPFVLLPSLSHPAAVVGSACGFLEMAEQFRDRGEPAPAQVFITVASGTTLAGFLLAAELWRRCGGDPIRVVGVQVYPGPVRSWTWALLRWTERFLGLRVRVPVEQIEVVSRALYGGFARFPSALAARCERLHEETGLRIDPIFGGKTWSVLESYVTARGTGDRPLLYWHCGYTRDWRAVGRAIRWRAA